MHTYFWIEILFEDNKDPVSMGPYLEYMHASEILLDHLNIIIHSSLEGRVFFKARIVEKLLTENGWELIAVRGKDIRTRG